MFSSVNINNSLTCMWRIEAGPELKRLLNITAVVICPPASTEMQM